MRCGIELVMHYMTNGQCVPEDLHPVNLDYLLHRAFKQAEVKTSFTLRDIEFPALMAGEGSFLTQARGMPAETGNPAGAGPAVMASAHGDLPKGRMHPMRSDHGLDQAEGLRRLLVRNPTRMVTLLSGKTGVGRTGTTINLAAAIARTGKEVLVLDENRAPDNIADQLGLHARFDLLDIAQQKCGYRDAVLNAHGFSVLQSARAMNFLSQMSHAEQQRVEKALAQSISSADVLLVEAAMPALMKSHDIRQGYLETMARGLAGREGGTVRQAPAGFEYGTSMLVVMDATTSGITDSYALIKKLAMESACLQFGIVVNKVADARAAMTVFDNIAKVAWHKLSVRLEYLGCIPRDERLKHAARQGRTVGEAYPGSISAKAFLDMAQGLLHLPLRREPAGAGVRPALPGLTGPLLQPARQHSKIVAHAVNF